VAALPLLASSSHNNSAPFASVAFAGHTLSGGYACTCGCPGCICDPGESLLECSESQRAISDKTDHGATPVGADTASDLDFGSSAMVLALAFFAWARFLRT